MFLSKVWIVQDSHLVPSDAVIAGNPDEHGMWKSKLGVTNFDFSIPFGKKDPVGHISAELECDGPLPSSYWHPKAGGIRYIVAG